MRADVKWPKELAGKDAARLLENVIYVRLPKGWDEDKLMGVWAFELIVGLYGSAFQVYTSEVEVVQDSDGDPWAKAEVNR